MVACTTAADLVWLPLQRGGASGEVGAAAEGELWTSFRRGDPAAFGRLGAQHEGSVYGLCLRLLGHAEEARDAAQEAFVRAYERRAGYDPGLPFRPWLLRIARNHCFDLRRRAASRPESGPLPAGALEPADAAQGADDRIAHAPRQARLAAAIARLPEEQREALLMFHQEQLSYREIAAVLDAPLGTVMTWLHRARAKLKSELGGEAGSAGRGPQPEGRSAR